MLKLSRIEMIGFKSFCDKAEIIFPQDTGVTAIVGPNGCGKSNIADAIAWVLGEQSVKTLRGSSMEDVIFNGTRERQPLGLAQVSLTLVDPEFQREAEFLPPDTKQETVFEGGENPGDSGPSKSKIRKRLEVKPGEVMVTRKLFRSGESEYLMNGRQCRLRDIQELFMGTGLGPTSYAIIEQGRVGQILSSKPTDRRMLIEEAAGTTKYKAKRKLAEAKLESAKLNLSRVHDIIEEVSRQLSSLKRQAAKARRYKELRETLREKTISILYSRLIELEESVAKKNQELAEASGRADAAQTALRNLETEQVATQQHSFALEDQLRARHELLAQTKLELDRAQNKKVYNLEQLAGLDQRIKEMDGEVASLAKQISELLSEIVLKQGEDDLIQSELQAIELEAAKGRDQADMLNAQVRSLEEGLDAERIQLLETVERSATLTNQISQIEETDARLVSQRERLMSELEASQKENEEFHRSHELFLQKVGDEKSELNRLVHEIEASSLELEGFRKEETDLQGAIDDLKRQQADALVRRQSIEEIVTHHAYVDEGVKQLLTSGQVGAATGFRPLGVLADFIDVDSENEQAVEELLRDELEFLLVESSQAAREGIEILRSRSGGRSTFVVPRKWADSGDGEPRTDPEILRQPGVLGALATMVRLEGRYAEWLPKWLPLLYRSYLVDAFETADRLAPQFPHAAFVTREGEVFRGCWIRGGRRSTGGPLSLKRELRGLAARLLDYESALTQSEGKREQVRGKAQEVESALQVQQQRRIELEKVRVGSDHQLQQVEAEVQRSGQKVALLEGEIARLEMERSQAREAQTVARQQLEELELLRQNIEKRLADGSERLREAKTQLELLAGQISEQRSKLASLVERKQASQQVLDRLHNDEQEVSRRRERLLQQQQATLNQKSALETSLLEIGNEIERLSHSKEESEGAINNCTQEAESLRKRLVELEEHLKSQRDELSRLMEAKSAVEVTVAKLETDLAHVRDACQQELDRPWEELKLLQTTRLEGEALRLAEEEHTQLRQKIDSMGAINMMALEEYTECEQRFEFLNAQRKDLLDSIADTTQTIQEIDQVSRQQFLEAFNAINEHFQETFKQLFGGGSGAMKLTDETDLQQSGIDLHAQPPGKKLQNVLLLSGGEKALTAIALLLAIFRYQPSPFCVLDEVDAPLDEANVERFSHMIAQLAGDTHFIVITHNKKTMEIARSMYGVTMQEAGVSKLVSVNFA